MTKQKESKEQEIIMRAALGERAAANYIVSRYKGSLLSYVTNIVPNREDARDIIQESFQKCFRKLPYYNPEYAFSTWLFTIAQNTALDFIRKKRLPSATNRIQEDAAAGDSINSAAPSPEDKMITDQVIEELLKSIQQLPPIYRSIAELRFIHDYPLEEIAKKKQIPVNTVKTRISRAKKLLNEIWKN